ncbi:MAG: ADP-ribosylglycohydrolase family protein [Candidatus Hydrogenedentes bacterium]|nr:ADP-ribosylglycohydrolase family protein [Candidatus Hydrogenedentota bacterium]
MKRIALLIASSLCCAAFAQDDYLQMPVSEYVSRMTAGWIGQMAGVGWGAPTEFQFNGQMVPASNFPEWKPEYVNQFWQDDLYVEMTFLKSLEDYGWDVTHKEAGYGFATSAYPLWHANTAGRKNLREGIAPPDSGHPQFNHHADDIDYQIEADYSGLIAPGMPNVPIALGEVFGRVMNYGDGLYGGQFVGAMYAAAFFETDPEAIVRKGLESIPSGSQYAECINDVLAWWKANPNDWEATWALIEAKYNENPEYRKASCGDGKKTFNIDAKINGAYIVMGLLYGQRDPDKTIEIATRCGQDSDCNPSSAAGILFTSLGLETVPEKFTSELKRDIEYTHTDYTFASLVQVCETLARDAVVRGGGKIEKDGSGQEVFFIRREQTRPSALEQSWDPGPIANSRYTDAEMDEHIRSKALSDGRPDMNQAIADFAPGWQIEDCGLEMDPGIRAEFRGRQRVLVTHPDDGSTPCIIWRQGAIPVNTQGKLRLTVSHHDGGDWQLIVKIDGAEVVNTPVSAETVHDGWLTVDIDLAPFAGKTVKAEILNQPTGWFCEAAYWGEISLIGF